MLDVTVLISTKNEEKNIANCIESVVNDFKKIYILDSFSTDSTIEICKQYPDVEVIQFEYRGGYPKKRQWALDNLDIKTSWILMLDADECVTNNLVDEIRYEISRGSAEGYFIKKIFHFMGKKFKFGGFSFFALCLFKINSAKYEELASDKNSTYDMEIHERVILNGPSIQLKNGLIHDDFKGLEAYLAKHNVYSSWEADIRTNRSFLSSIKSNLFGDHQERRRFLKTIVIRIPFEPIIWFIYHYIVKLGFLEGRRGLIACLIRANYIAQIKWKIYERALNSKLNERSE